MEETFLKYLDEWEASVHAREGYTPNERKAMILSSTTMGGLRMTCMEIIYNMYK